MRGHPEAREDYWEHDLEFAPMARACAQRGIEFTTVIWDDPALDAGAFDAFVIGTTWDYASQPRKFLTTLDRLSKRRPLFNAPSVVRWNLEKTYLKDLLAHGVPVVPTLWRPRASATTIVRAFDELGVDEIVVKPQVGASSWRQVRLRRGDPTPDPASLPPGRTMIQPFLHAAEREGEYAFVFFDREFSHCALKVAAPGDYRVQSMFGAKERPHAPSAGELKLATQVLDAVDEPLLYARVDMMRGLDGELGLMELELVEPYLYPEQGPHMGDAFATALERRLGGTL